METELENATGVGRSGPSPSELKQLLEGIVDSGMELPSERDLVVRFGVPRSRLRKVLADLRASGRIPQAQIGRRASRETSPHIHELARVTNPTDVIELRLVIEPHLARLAAVRASAVETARIQRLATSAQDAETGAADLSFHLEIASASRNALGRELYAILRRVGADTRVRLPARNVICPGRRATRDREHLAVANAIASRDPDRAEEAMRSHLAKVQSVILERLLPDQAVEAGSFTATATAAE